MKNILFLLFLTSCSLKVVHPEERTYTPISRYISCVEHKKASPCEKCLHEYEKCLKNTIIKDWGKYLGKMQEECELSFTICKQLHDCGVKK